MHSTTSFTLATCQAFGRYLAPEMLEKTHRFQAARSRQVGLSLASWPRVRDEGKSCLPGRTFLRACTGSGTLS